MKKILSVVVLLSIVFSYSNVYAMTSEAEVKEFIIKIEGIDENIEKIDVVSFEECEMEEIGYNYETTHEVVEPYGDGKIEHLQKHDTENYYVKQTVRYNYLSGRFKDDIEHAIGCGSFWEVNENNIIDYDYAYDSLFKTKEDFERACSMVIHQGVVCAKTTKYDTAYKLTAIKEVDVSNIKSNELVYKHDDLENLKIGLRLKNEKGEYKTFIPYNDAHKYIYRNGSNPIHETIKLIIFDYSEITYQSNTNKPYPNYLEPYAVLYGGIISVVILLLIILYVIYYKIKNKLIKK